MDQPELFAAQTSWFHFFKDIVESGKLAAMEATTVKVYLVLKSYSNFYDGQSIPNIEKIIEKAGVSRPSVLRALNELTELKLIERKKVGRRNVYQLKETLEIKDVQGQTAVTTKH